MQDLQATIQMVLDYIKGIWIKKRYIIISSWLLCPIGLVLIAQMPDVYQSTARVYVDTRSMLKPLLRGLAIQTNPQAEIRLLAQTLKSRQNLEEIAINSDLDITAKNQAEMSQIINDLKDKIKISKGNRQNIYTLSYQHGDREVARRVVAATLDKFVESAMGQTRVDTDSATRFIEEQIEEYAQRLEAAEQRVANFKKQYGELLSGDGSDYYSEIDRLKSQVEQIDLVIAEKQTQLDSLKAKFSNSVPGGETTDSSSFDVATEYDDRISSLQANLDELQIRYTDKHPDVVQTKEKLELLERLRDEKKQELLAQLADGQLTTSNISDNAVVQDLTIVINNLDSEIASLEVRKSSFVNKLAELEQKIDLVPDIEAKRVALNRDYGITQRKYEELLNRKESADLSRKADLSTEDVQFRVIEPPSAPFKPIGPNRLLFYTGLVFLSFSLGAAVAFIISQLNPVVLNANVLTNLTQRPVFGLVSDIDFENIKKKEKRNLYIFLLSSGLVIGLYLLFMATEIIMNTTPIKLAEKML